MGMTENRNVKKQSLKELNDSVSQGNVEAKTELARRLLKGKDVDKDEKKAISILEECAALGDAQAMFMLAVCCTLGRGVEHNMERAKALLSEAAGKGFSAAQCLNQLINKQGKRESVEFEGLFITCAMCITNLASYRVLFVFKQDVCRDETKMAVLALNFITCNSVSLQGEQTLSFMKRHIII